MSSSISIFNNIYVNSGYLGVVACTGDVNIGGSVSISGDLAVTGTVEASSAILGYASMGSADFLTGYVPRLCLHDALALGVPQPEISGGATGYVSLITLTGRYTNPFGGLGEPSNNDLYVKLYGDLDVTGDTLSRGPITSLSSGNFSGQVKCAYINSPTGISIFGTVSGDAVVSPGIHATEYLTAVESYIKGLSVTDDFDSPTSSFGISTQTGRGYRSLSFSEMQEESGSILVTQTQPTGATPGVEYVEFENGRKIIWFEDSTPSLFAAPPGSLFINSQGSSGTGTALYIKATGTGTLGWRNIA